MTIAKEDNINNNSRIDFDTIKEESSQADVSPTLNASDKSFGMHQIARILGGMKGANFGTKTAPLTPNSQGGEKIAPL